MRVVIHEQDDRETVSQEGSQKQGRTASRSDRWIWHRSGLSFCLQKYQSSTLKSELGLGYTYKYSKQDSQVFERFYKGKNLEQ